MPIPSSVWALIMLKRSLLVKSFCWLLVTFIGMCIFSGCKENKDEVRPDSTETVTFIDALDRTVTVKKKPQRVAALLGSFADVWQLSGGNVCAATDDAWDDFGLSLDNAVNIGGAHSPSLESVFSSDPEFVLASASTAADVNMLQSLQNAGVTVAYFDVDCFDDYLEMLNICTDITDRKDLYEKNGLAIRTKILEIKADVEKTNLPQEQRTVLLLRASSGFVKAKGSKGTILGEMLNDLGLKNIADSDETLLENLSVESVIKVQPYRIFVVTMGDDTQKAISNLKKQITENPAWSSLDAVTHERVHIMDRRYFNLKPNAKWAESYEKLKGILLEK